MTASFAAAFVCAIAAGTAAATAAEDPSAPLRAEYEALKQRLEQSPFQQRLLLESVEGRHDSQADVYAVVDHPIATVGAALTNPANWCDVLILHPNVKYCRAMPRGQGAALSVAIGKKSEQPLTQVHRLEFVFNVAASLPDYMQVGLDARKGPLGTGNYRIALEAVRIDNDRAFLHLRYSYTFGFWARVAMRMYLQGAARDKVGFTAADVPGNPQAAYIGGFRGVTERNSMRYYLAIDAYLGTLAAPAPERVDRSLERWFDDSERYPRQLHEMDRDTYLAMKRREYLRQQTER